MDDNHWLGFHNYIPSGRTGIRWVRPERKNYKDFAVPSQQELKARRRYNRGRRYGPRYIKGYRNKNPQEKNHFVAKKQQGSRDKRRMQQKMVWRVKDCASNRALPHLRSAWNQDRRNLRGCYWAPKPNHQQNSWQEQPAEEEEKRPYCIKCGKDGHWQHKCRQFNCPYILKPAEEAYLSQMFGKEVKSGTAPHDHAVCAQFRSFAVKNCEDYLLDRHPRILDVFGSARLPHDRKHSVMPIKTAHDKIRNRPPASCTCEVDRCGHYLDNDAIFAVDAVYYIDPAYIVRVLSHCGNDKFYTLHHSLRGFAGSSMCGTYSWVRSGDLIKCTVGTNQITYSHKSLDWLLTNTWFVGNKQLTYEIITTFDTVQFGVFILSNKIAVKTPEPLTVAKVELVDSGYIYNTTRTEYVDQQLLGIANKFLRSKVIDEKTFRDLHAAIKRAEVHESFGNLANKFPNEWNMMVNNVVVAAILNRDNRISLQFIKENNEKVYERNLQVTDMFKPTCTQILRRTIAAAKDKIILTIFAAGAVYGFQQLMIGNPMAFFGNVFRPDICLITDYAIHPSTPIRNPEKVRIGKSHFLRLVPQKNVFEGPNRFYVTDAIKCTFDGECGCSFPDDRKRGVLVLSYIDGHEPFSFSPCEGNTWFALRMRFMRDLPLISTEVWEKMENSLFMVLDSITQKRSRISKKGFFSAWVARYPVTKQQKLINARDHPESSVFEFGATVCCKFEVGILKDPLKPRAFFPKKEENLVKNGPLMYWIKKNLTILFNGVKTPFIFGSGNNNFQLGAKFENACVVRNFNPAELVSVEIDLSMCETTMRGPFLILESEIYRRFGCTEGEISYLLNHVASFGKSSKGNLKFSMPFCRESGTANTTVGNTVVFSTWLWAACLEVGLKTTDFFCLIGGDDACVYLKPCHVPLLKQAIAIVSNSGLKPEPIYYDNVWAGRFYSGRMVQVKRKGALRYVHMPLIGRCLAKNLCCKYNGQKLEPWLRDTSIGQIYTWEHVPLLRQVNRRLRAKYETAVGRCRIEMPYRDINAAKVLSSYCDETFQQLAVVYGVEVGDLNQACQDLDLHFSKDWIGKSIENEVVEIMAGIDLK